MTVAMQMGERKRAHGFLHAASLGLTNAFYRLSRIADRTLPALAGPISFPRRWGGSCTATPELAAFFRG